MSALANVARRAASSATATTLARAFSLARAAPSTASVASMASARAFGTSAVGGRALGAPARARAALTATTTASWTNAVDGAACARAYARKVVVGAGGKTKTKIKPWSSYKGRFQVTGSGKKILRKRKGKRHCAFAKTPKQRMRLRSTTLVHASLVQNMRKLGFKLR